MKTLLKVMAILGCISLPCIILTIIIISISRPAEHYIPYGKWKNEAIDLYLDINPEKNKENHGVQVSYCGVYRGEEIYVSTPPYNYFYIVAKEYKLQQEEQGTVPDRNLIYMTGPYELKNGKLYFHLNSNYEEMVGCKTIVFDLIEAYDLPESSTTSE